MAETLSEFIRKQAQQQRVNTIGAANIVLDAVEQKPDEVAGALQLADEFARTTGGPTPPVPMVQEYGNVFRREIERRRNGTILSGAPRLADWVRDPVNAALAKDALQELSWFEGFGRGLANTGRRAAEGLVQMGNQLMLEQTARRARDRGLTFGEILEEESLSDKFTDENGNPIRLYDGSNYVRAFARWVDARYADLIGTDDAAAAQEYGKALAANVERLRSIPKSQIATEFETDAMVDGASLGEALANFGSAAVRNPLGALSWMLETAGETAPQLAAALGTTLLTRNPAAGVAVGAGGAYATERYRSPSEFFEEKGLDLSKPEDIQRLMNDPELMREAAERGVIRGLVIGTFAALSMGVAGQTMARNPLVDALAQGLTQAVAGSSGEYFAQALAGQEIDWNEILAEGFAEFATTPVDMGIAGRRFVRQRKEAEKAEETRAKVEEVMGAAGSSVLRNRMPDKFREFLERATEGSEVENVFIDSERFVEYFQEIGVDPFEIADTLEGVGAEELRMATVSGGDLKIPVATLATAIPGSGHEAFFIEQARFDPDDMSPSLAAEFNAKVEELRQEAYELAEELRLEEERSRSFEQEIYDTMVSRLRVAGRSTNEATTAAALWVANYRTAAADEGLTLEEYLERYPLPQVRGEIPEGFKTKNVDALTRTLAEASSRRSAGVERRGRTLLEFISDYGGINDPGGELRARDAEEIKRGRGKKTLRLSRGRMAAARDMFGGGGGKKYGIDDVAQAAIEAGYMADNPVVVQYMRAMEQGEQVPDIGAALLDAIDEELRGNPQYSSHDIVDEDAIRTDEALDEIEEYLSRLGVGLDDPDDVIRAAIERDQDERRREYGQSGGPRGFLGQVQGRMIDAVLAGAKLDRAIVFPVVPPVMRALGVKDTPVALTERVVWKAVDKHGMTPDQIKAALDGMSDPLAVFDSATTPDSLVFVVELPGEAAPAIVPVHYNRKVGRIDVAEVASIYRKDGAGSFLSWVNQGLTRYINMQNADAWVRSRGLRLPKDGSLRHQQGKKVLQHRDVFKGAVYEQAVDTSSEAFKRWFGDSKVVDYQGKPLVVYHGTASEFEAFSSEADAKHIKLPGFYFTPDANIAERFAASASRREIRDEDGYIVGYEGAQIIPAYLSIQNPVEINLDDAETGRMTNADVVLSMLETAREAGHDGAIIRGWSDGSGEVQYVAFSPEQIKSVYNRGTFDPDDPRILYQGPRGSIQFPLGGVADGETIINLFQSANLSTFLHESGHYFLANLQDRAMRGSTVAQERLNTVREWWRSNADAVAKDAMRARAGVEVTAADVNVWLDNGTTGDLDKDMALDIGAHEQWARAFEAYLMEGKAPSIELRSAFEKFRAWLISVYRYITGLNVNVTDDLRAVFDRMLATDEEISKANERAGSVGPVFASAEAMGLTEDEYAAYLKLRAQSEDEAKARLLAETMAPIKREQEKWFKEERAKVRAEVEREINAWRQYRAIEWMGNRRWLGEGNPDALPDMRMSKDILVRRYGAGILKTLPRGQQTLYAVEGGLDPDDIAGWFGFSSGDEMIQSLEQMPPRKEAIEAETDKRMRDLHGDPLNDGSVEVDALDAIHSERRGEWIAAELKAIAEVAGVDVAITAKEARHTARQTIARMRVRDAMNANRFLAAERKAAEEAARLGAMLAREGVWMNNARRRIATKARAAVRGEASVDAAARQIDQANRSTENYNETVGRLIEAKRRQLINQSLYMEARAVADEVGKAERFVAKLQKRSHREKIAGAGRREGATVDYLAAIDEILERYDFRRMSGRQEERRASLNDFVQAMIEAGRENELAIPDNVMRDAQRRPYKTLPVEELRGVVDSLKNIEHIALRWNKLIDEQRERDLDEAVESVVAAFDANVRGKAPGRVPDAAELRRDAGRRFLNLVLNADTLLREIDGFKDFGNTYTNIKTPIDEAMDRLTERRTKAAADLERIYSVYSKDERRRMAVREHVPALGISLSKWERIAIALNTGNEGNFQRLTDDRVAGHFTEAQVNAVLASLDQRDADFIQSIWDFLESFRDDIAKRERRVTGTEPKWVDPRPVEIGGKMLRGGYYPLKYDPRLTDLARDDAVDDLARNLQTGRFAKAQTRNGHLKERAQASGRAVFIDMSVLNSHLNQMLYDLELSEAVSNSWRILRDERVRSAFRRTGKLADYDALEAWLLDVGTGELRSGDFLQRMARTAKSNFTAAKLAFNLSTVAIQITGVAQSMVVIGKKNFALGVQDMFRPGVFSEVAAKSTFMRHRRDTFNKDIFDFYNDPKIKPYASRWGDFKREWLGPLAFWAMTHMQYVTVDMPTWLGAYRQGLQQFGNDEAKAIAHADRMVARAQASGLFSDRSAIERGSTSKQFRQNDVVRLFTALGSYMFAKFNVAYERAMRSGRVMRDEGFTIRSVQEALSLTVDMAFLFTLEAVLYAAIKGRLPDDDDDDENWPLWLAKETGLSVLSTIPLARDVASAGQGFEGGGAYGAITKELSGPFIQAMQGEVDRAFVKSIINATGIATGLPSAQINRAVDAAMREAEGEDVSPAEYLLGKMKK